MRASDLTFLVSALRGPIEQFVRDSRARISLLITGSGQVLAQHGFTSSYEVMNVASLAAAAHASSLALADLLEVGRWSHLHHDGPNQQIFLATLDTPIEKLALVVIFDAESSLGLVQYFFGRLAERIERLPELASARQPGDRETFERDLNEGLDRIFSPEPRSEA